MRGLQDCRGQPNPDVFTVEGRLQYLAGVPSIIAGKGFSIVDDGAGLFTVTTIATWSFYLGGGGHRESVLAVGGTVQMIKGTDNQALKKVSFRILGDADAVEDPVDGDGVYFYMRLQGVGLPVK